MTDLQILVLAIVQGLTEFLPISSSGHLILAPYLFGFSDQGLAFDVAVHLGSLIAVLGYFRAEVWAIATAWLGTSLAGRPPDSDSRLGWAIIVGTLPVVLAGFLLKSLVETELRAPWIIAAATIGFGLLLGLADTTSRRERRLDTLDLRDALLIGTAQVLALIPGTSRSGITMTAGLALGLDRASASRFSFLLAIPTILASSTLVTLDLVRDKASVDWQSLGLGVALSAVAAYLAIHVFLRVIERLGMWPFVAYRIALGVLIFWLVY
jgi:undecaprenyl-diphosphatase